MKLIIRNGQLEVAPDRIPMVLYGTKVLSDRIADTVLLDTTKTRLPEDQLMLKLIGVL